MTPLNYSFFFIQISFFNTLNESFNNKTRPSQKELELLNILPAKFQKKKSKAVEHLSNFLSYDPKLFDVSSEQESENSQHNMEFQQQTQQHSEFDELYSKQQAFLIASSQREELNRVIGSFLLLHL